MVGRETYRRVRCAPPQSRRPAGAVPAPPPGRGLDHHRIGNVVHRQIHSTPWSVASWLIDGQGVLERVGRSGGVFEINALGRRQHPGKSTNTAPGPHPRFTHLTAGEVLDRQTRCYRPLEELCSNVAPAAPATSSPRPRRCWPRCSTSCVGRRHSTPSQPEGGAGDGDSKPHHGRLNR